MSRANISSKWARKSNKIKVKSKSRIALNLNWERATIRVILKKRDLQTQLLETFTGTKSSIKSESWSFLWRREQELILLLCTAREWEPGFVGKYPCQVTSNAASKLSPVWARKLKVHLCINVCRCCLIRGTCAADGRTPALLPFNNWRLVKKKKRDSV